MRHWIEWVVTLAPLASFVVTAMLCVITAVYVALTKRIADANKRAAESARDSLQALVLQGLTDTAIAGIRDMLQNPELARHSYVGWSSMPAARIQAFMLADIWFLHWENVLAQKHHLPKEFRELYDKAIGHIFRSVPVLHEWLEMSGGMWSPALHEMAKRNQPASPTPPFSPSP